MWKVWTGAWHVGARFGGGRLRSQLRKRRGSTSAVARLAACSADCTARPPVDCQEKRRGQQQLVATATRIAAAKLGEAKPQRISENATECFVGERSAHHSILDYYGLQTFGDDKPLLGCGGSKSAIRSRPIRLPCSLHTSLVPRPPYQIPLKVAFPMLARTNVSMHPPSNPRTPSRDPANAPWAVSPKGVSFRRGIQNRRSKFLRISVHTDGELKKYRVAAGWRMSCRCSFETYYYRRACSSCFFVNIDSRGSSAER